FLSSDGSGNLCGSPLTLDDLFQRNFQIHDPEATWMSTDEILFRSWEGDVFKVNIYSNQTELLIKNTTFVTFKATKFAVSPDMNFVLLGYDVQQVFKHSFLASYLIYNLFTREVQELNPPEVSNSVLQFASWGVQGQQLIYIFENNIYYQNHTQSSSWRLTSSGQEGVVFNGIADWLYEEEVLDSQVAHWWSPDGSRLAYLTINDTLVPRMVLPRFTGSLYPRGMEYPYPKVGLRSPADLGWFSDFYISMVKWVSRQKLSVRWVNRAQNVSILSLCDATTGDCMKKHVMTSEAWLDRQTEEPLFSRDLSRFFISSPGAFSHISMISNQSDAERVRVQQLTSGNWKVSRVLAYDENSRSIYFLSTEEGSAQQLSEEHPFHRDCLSCSLFKPNCSFYDAELSPDHQHVLLNCRGTNPIIPNQDVSGCLAVETNVELRRALTDRTVPRRERRILQRTGSDSLCLKCFLLNMFVCRDSAPGGQDVNDRFALDWDSVLVTSDRVVVARVDRRGRAVHQNLGTADVQDQMAAYGGFLSSLLLLSHSSQIKCGVAVAPITNWRLYGEEEPQQLLTQPNTSSRNRKLISLCISSLPASVHFQHSAELLQLLSALNVSYTLQIFPDEGHRIISVKSERYMLTSMLNFFRRCFQEEAAVVMETSKEED
uniref:Inactive dipeptidyl peptidase 10-like n=1 Tax=Cyprinodon variegatus TaxID=28743 RepID=A0A3Q2FN64_CYPVA